MYWILLLIVFMVWSSGRSNKLRRKQIVVIKPTVGHDHSHRKFYSSDDLRSIRDQWTVKTGNRRQTPNYDTIRKVKELHINKRRIRLQKHRKQKLRSLNLSNLKQVEIDDSELSKDNKSIKIATVNARSIKGKITEIISTIKLHNFDVTIVTETWLSENDETVFPDQTDEVEVSCLSIMMLLKLSVNHH